MNTGSGHAFFLWSAYGACAVAIAIELWALRRRRAQARAAVRQAIDEAAP